MACMTSRSSTDAKRDACPHFMPIRSTASAVVALHELPRVGTQVDLGGLGPLVGDPLLDQITGEHAAIEQELVVCLQRVHRLGERAGYVDDARELLLGELVQVGVDRIAGLQ